MSVILAYVVDPLVAVSLAKPERSHFSHIVTAKVKKILPKSSRRDNCRRWIGFSEDDANFTAKGADIRLRRRPGKLRTNAFSVKLRRSHAPLRRTTRSTTCWRHLRSRQRSGARSRWRTQALALE